MLGIFALHKSTKQVICTAHKQLKDDAMRCFSRAVNVSKCVVPGRRVCFNCFGR